MRVLHVAGARPNFMKVVSVMKGLAEYRSVDQLLVHTGQHYDEHMSRIFFRDLGIPDPDINLGVGSGSHAVQTGQIMIAIEPVIERFSPNVVVVVGDVNSTVAAALVASKLGIRVAHVEAGLRSFDWSMPEEINRVVTDRLSHYLFTSERSGNENLKAEGIGEERIFFVGNTMIDTLLTHLGRAKTIDAPKRWGVEEGGYVLATIHRPSNVDSADALAEVVAALARLSGEIPVLFPVHPRTQNRLSEYGLRNALGKVRVMDPLGYLDFLALMAGARAVLTDSGGIQEETTALGVRCLTLRPNTERPVTIERGTNQLVELDAECISRAALSTNGNRRRKARPPLWDGRAGERIAHVLVNDTEPGF